MKVEGIVCGAASAPIDPGMSGRDIRMPSQRYRLNNIFSVKYNITYEYI